MTLLPHEIKAEAQRLGPWYHSIRLLPDYITSGHMEKGCKEVWDGTRHLMKRIDYAGKTVLDLGSLDGMWAFEAEERRPLSVVASDIFQMGGKEFFERFCFAKLCRNSKVAMVPNADIHDLPNRMDSIFRAWGIQNGFDIIQCTGLLYHVQNPLLAIQQMRRCCHLGSVLLLETAITERTDSTMEFNYDKHFYDDPVTYWIPSLRCLKEMLAISGFRAREDSILISRRDRVSLIADAEQFEDREAKFG